MSKVVEAVAHPSDGELVRYLDTEMSELEERRLQTHVGTCDECSARLDALATQSRSVSHLLAGEEADGPDAVTRARALAAVRRAHSDRARLRRRRLSGGIGAAAAVLILLLAGVEPVRAWISDRWDAVAGRDSAPAAPVVEPTRAAPRHSSVVAFTPRGPRFDLQIENAQEVGSVTIEVRDVDRASAQVLDAGDETVLVLPAGLRVENARTSRASYLVTVPSEIAMVRVSVGGEPTAIIRTDQQNAPWSRTFALSPAR